jgi:hypothetical protein
LAEAKKKRSVMMVIVFGTRIDGREDEAWIPDDLRSTAFRSGTGMTRFSGLQPIANVFAKRQG